MKGQTRKALLILIIVALAATIGIVYAMTFRAVRVGNEQQAIQVGRDFFDTLDGNAPAGNAVLVRLGERTPNFYWQNLYRIEKPNVGSLELCWTVTFEQALRPGHFFEVWVDAFTGEVVGGAQYF